MTSVSTHTNEESTDTNQAFRADVKNARIARKRARITTNANLLPAGVDISRSVHPAK
jgi:hypothetical protein